MGVLWVLLCCPRLALGQRQPCGLSAENPGGGVTRPSALFSDSAVRATQASASPRLSGVWSPGVGPTQ